MQDKCCNCGGRQRGTFGSCEVRKRAVEIEQVKTVVIVSYADAVKKVQAQKGKDKVNQPSRPEVRQAEENEALAVDKLILFIAYVINCTDQVKRKTEN